jgi:hypothetical protein|tara:strand:- start:237 stop:407 length:171 start_codon:yes stop_codon:yes gene_type:complete
METNLINKEETIKFLLEEVKNLREKVELLENNKGFVCSPALERIWNNESDEIWDKI